MTDPYQPIPCGIHSNYELAILRRTRLDMRWRDADGNTHHAPVLPLDTETVSTKEEFLLVQHEDGRRERIRLDRILQAVPLN